MAESTPPVVNTPVAKPKAVKVGDTVHFLRFDGMAAGPARFRRFHAEAKIEKLYFNGRFADLIAEHEDPDLTIRLKKSPRDDTATQMDSWHPIES